MTRTIPTRRRARMLARGAAPAILLALAACSGAPKAICPADWRAAGLADGAAGASQFDDRAASCAALTPPLTPPPEAAAAYAEGLVDGRTAYCMPSAALKLGRSGRGLRAGTCPEAQREPAQDFNRRGLSEWDIAQDIVDARSDALQAQPGSAGLLTAPLAWAREASLRQELNRRQAENNAAAAEADAAIRAGRGG